MKKEEHRGRDQIRLGTWEQIRRVRHLLYRHQHHVSGSRLHVPHDLHEVRHVHLVDAHDRRLPSYLSEERESAAAWYVWQVQSRLVDVTIREDSQDPRGWGYSNTTARRTEFLSNPERLETGKLWQPRFHKYSEARRSTLDAHRGSSCRFRCA